MGDKEPCPLAWVVLDSNPHAESNPSKDAFSKFERAQFGSAVALSPHTDFECMRERLRVFIRNVADQPWTSHLHWMPYVLPQVFDAQTSDRTMCDVEGAHGSFQEVLFPLVGMVLLTLFFFLVLY